MTRVAPRTRQAGFSLIELAIVLVIVGLLVGGGIAALTATTEQTRRTEAKRQLEHVREALYGFAMSNGRLPCPDTDNPPDGRENAGATDCSADGGALPWVDLGLGRRDPWGSPLRYRVERGGGGEPNFADPDADADDPAFSLTDPASTSTTYLIAEDGDGDTIVDTTPAIVLSYGPQGSQVWTDSGFNCPAAGTDGFSTDETGNCDGDNTFVAAEYRPPDATDGRFDDVVIWLPLPVLKSRMVDAGLLP